MTKIGKFTKMLKLVALLSVLVAMVAAAPEAAKPAIDARIRALERKVEALAVHEKGVRARAVQTLASPHTIAPLLPR